jgi:hypothetical protein
MAELVAHIFRIAQAAVGLAVLAIVFAPVALWLWAYVWPWLLLIALLAFFAMLDGIANRLEAARGFRVGW